jgi:hypothetical protein
MTARDHKAVSEETRFYACVYCARSLPAHDGVVIHDDVPHPETATFDEEDRPQ